jgi:hypothetical protein
MATYIVRMLERADEFCGVLRDVATGSASPFADPDELVALLLIAHRHPARRPPDLVPLRSSPADQHVERRNCAAPRASRSP